MTPTNNDVWKSAPGQHLRNAWPAGDVLRSHSVHVRTPLLAGSALQNAFAGSGTPTILRLHTEFSAASGQQGLPVYPHAWHSVREPPLPATATQLPKPLLHSVPTSFCPACVATSQSTARYIALNRYTNRLLAGTYGYRGTGWVLAGEFLLVGKSCYIQSLHRHRLLSLTLCYSVYHHGSFH